MILCDRVKIKVNNTRVYRDLGYDCNFGDLIVIALEHLPKKSHIEIHCKCDDCGIKFSRRYNTIHSTTDHLCRFCSRKAVAETINKLGKNTLKGSEHPNWNANKSEFLSYAYQVRQLSEKIYQKHLHILNPENHQRTLCGVRSGYQLDHKISVKEGFEKQILVHEIAT